MSPLEALAQWNTRIKRTPLYQSYRNSVPYVALKEWHKALRRRVNLRKYLGEEYCCPVCGTHLRAFKQTSGRYAKMLRRYGYAYPYSSIETLRGTRCPACDASDRDRLYALFLDDEFRSFDKRRTYRVVDFAPTRGIQAKLKSCPFIAYRSADLYWKSVDDQIDITDMHPYADHSFDLFVCSHVLEHVVEDRKAMKELFRILRPGGFGIVMVPIVRGVDETHEDPEIKSPEFRWKYYGLDDHVRQYGKRDFVDRLTAVGFRVDQLGIDHFGKDAFRRADLAEDSVLYVVRK